MAVKWVDRVPTNPNRMKITPETGSPYYATVERADNPSVEGTPVNAANLNAMQEASGLTANRTVYVSTTGSNTVGDGSQTSPYATINKALSTIPKNLNGYTASIVIDAGTYAEGVTVGGFHGGRIDFTGAEGDVITINSLQVRETNVFSINNIVLTTVASSGVYIIFSTILVNTKLSITGNHAAGIIVNTGSQAYIRSLEVNGTTTEAVRCANGARLSLDEVSGENSGAGFRAVSGGWITFGTTTLSAATLYVTSAGGRIYSGSQTDVPNY